MIAERVARRLGSNALADSSDAKPGQNVERAPDRPRARVINFVSPAPPAATRSSIINQNIPTLPSATPSSSQGPRVTQSPWLAPFAAAAGDDRAAGSAQIPLHPSQERFGVEEAAVSELVEFFENEKQCTIDPSGKPCDHCAMCSSRGF